MKHTFALWGIVGLSLVMSMPAFAQVAPPNTQTVTPTPAAAPATTSPQTPPQTGANTGAFTLQLPACVSTGRCTVDDIVITGVAFANLLMSLSGVLFFATFVYGGSMYLLSFGRSEWVTKGTKAMTGAMIGMGIVLSAWTIVNYIATTLRMGPV